jgi:hypothetical protein
MSFKKNKRNSFIILVVLELFIMNLIKCQSDDNSTSKDLIVLENLQMKKIDYHNFSSTIWKDNLIIFGGCSLDLVCNSNLLIFNIPNNSYKEYNEQFYKQNKQKFPTKRQDHSSLIVGDTLLIVGGSNDTGILNDIWMFDLNTQKWKELEFTGEEFLPRANHELALLSHSIF